MTVNIPKPNKIEIEKYLKLWDSLDNYVFQERSLKKLFTVTYPLNNNMDDVLVKVCTLNDFYSTNIFSPFKVAKHIIETDVDKRIIEKDLTLVNDLAIVKVTEDKTKNFYSFATKYCSHHKPETFPIFDSYVEKILLHFRDVDKFYSFEKTDLKNYVSFKETLLNFQQFYSLLIIV